MTPGSILLRFRQTFAHGVRAAYFREIVRPRILATPPVEGLDDATCEIHVLTSSTDWLNLIWALKSFFFASGRRYRLAIHEDGSLSHEHLDVLSRHFPDARLITKQEADREVLPTLEAYPRCHAFRSTNHLAPKLFDFPHYMRSDRMLLVDSDVLFFEEPVELLRRIESASYRLNTVNADVSPALTISPEDALRLSDVTVEPRFNSGLGLIHRASINPEWIEEFLALPGALGHFWRIEQTMFALCSARFGGELLPQPYDVHLDGGIDGAPCRHYVGAIRHKMYEEGLRRLVKQGLLDQKGVAVYEQIA